METNVPLGGKRDSYHLTICVEEPHPFAVALGSLTVVSEFNKWGQVVNDEALCS
jgi:hypothetical protein